MKFQPLIPELYCSEFARSLTFYTETLDFVVVYARPEERFAFLEREGAQLMIEQPVTRSWLTAEMIPPYGRGINFQMTVSDAGSLYARCLAKNCQIFLALEEKWYRVREEMLGCRQFIIQDPDGYLLRFSEDIGTKEAL